MYLVLALLASVPTRSKAVVLYQVDDLAKKTYSFSRVTKLKRASFRALRREPGLVLAGIDALWLTTHIFYDD